MRICWKVKRSRFNQWIKRSVVTPSSVSWYSRHHEGKCILKGNITTKTITAEEIETWNLIQLSLAFAMEVIAPPLTATISLRQFKKIRPAELDKIISIT